MTSMTQMLSRTGKFLSDNSPVIFTAIGVTGALTTAFLTGKASFKAAQIIADEQLKLDAEAQSHTLEGREKFELVWKLYVPAVGSAFLTVASIITASQIGTRRAAALASAYKLSQRAWDEYKEKVVERLGVPKEQKLRDDLAQDQVNKNPPSAQNLIFNADKVLCFDAYTGRYFHSTMEDLKRADNQLNRQILEDYFAALSDFYDLINLPRTTFSDNVGWNMEKPLHLLFSGTVSENGIPCMVIKYEVEPISGYDRVQ